MATQLKTATTVKAAPKNLVNKRPVREAKAAAEPKINAHIAAGVKVDRYTGLSSYINKNRKTRVLLDAKRDHGSMTPRQQAALYALRDAYGNKSWPVRGFDNGVLRDLLAAGLITIEGGTKQVIDGANYLIDGERPVVATITKAGIEYGKV